MPIYEYRCTACDRTLEAIQKLDDAPLSRCEACGGKLEKLVSRAAFLLKGGGWFQQDYSKPSSSPSSNPDSGGDGGTTKKEKSDAESVSAGAKTTAGGCGSGSCGCKN